jgi:hypothetical protein
MCRIPSKYGELGRHIPYFFPFNSAWHQLGESSWRNQPFLDKTGSQKMTLPTQSGQWWESGTDAATKPSTEMVYFFLCLRTQPWLWDIFSICFAQICPPADAN